MEPLRPCSTFPPASLGATKATGCHGGTAEGAEEVHGREEQDAEEQRRGLIRRGQQHRHTGQAVEEEGQIQGPNVAI